MGVSRLVGAMTTPLRGWFGESWGAPCCEPEDHIPTPIGLQCGRCREPIKLGDQGVVAPAVTLAGAVIRIAHHIDCYVQVLLPHGPECPHCRGRERSEHYPGCAYRERGDNCDCIRNPFAREGA